MDYVSGIPALASTDPVADVPLYTDELRAALLGTWVDLTLENGWSVASSLTPQYRFIPGFLCLRGRVTGGTAGTTIATVPGIDPTVLSQTWNDVIRDGGGNSYGALLVNTEGAITAGSVVVQPNINTSVPLG